MLISKKDIYEIEAILIRTVCENVWAVSDRERADTAIYIDGITTMAVALIDLCDGKMPKE